MNVIEVFKQAFDSIRANKLRSSLTLLAISVGVFAIISANTAVLVLDNYFKDTLSLMGGDVISISKYPSISMGPTDWDKYRNRQDITIEQMETLDELAASASGIGPNRSYTTTRVSYEEEQRSLISAFEVEMKNIYRTMHTKLKAVGTLPRQISTMPDPLLLLVQMLFLLSLNRLIPSPKRFA